MTLLDMSKDAQPETKPFKEQLDQAAREHRTGANKPNPVVQKS